MAKEQSHTGLMVEIHSKVGNNLSAEDWNKLNTSAGNSFTKVRENFLWAGQCRESETRRFFRVKLELIASSLGEWKFIARNTGKDQHMFERCIKKIYQLTKTSRILYRWEELEKLLPDNHHLMPEVARKIKEIKASKKKK